MSEPIALSVVRRRARDVFPVRIAGPLDLGAVDHVRRFLERIAGLTTHVLLSCEAVSAVDPAAG